MFEKNKRFLLLIVIFLIQFFTIVSLSLSYEAAARQGNAYKFKIEGYDPIDPLRGRYLDYMIDTETIEDTLGDYTGKCYITLAKDQEGYAYLDKVYKEKPKGVDYITANKYGLDYYETPFTKYYINEDIALKAEEMIRNNREDSYVLVKIKNGKSIVEGLYVKDKLIDKYFS
ncbi:MAG: hypothetical protein K0R69_461 [Clostridia bacterium]|jgi:uncharacterized membrane-anchored protein|nr:hypothetical protein [Clostridia bacterium]